MRSPRAQICTVPEGIGNFRFAEEQRFILAEERTFLRPVEETVEGS